MQDLVHKMAKASVLWLRQSSTPQAEAAGSRWELDVCK